MKRDGHTHTEYCPHGNVDDMERLIIEAKRQGFKEYSLTEHAPLPPQFEELAGGPAFIWQTASMAINDVEHYLKKAAKLKKKYASDMQIHIGFEVDYLEAFENWTRDFLNEYGPLTDDGILSVHFLQGVDGLRAIDMSSEDYNEGIVTYEKSFQHAQETYYRIVLQSLEADLGSYKPIRLGHISLCQKFQHAFDEPTEFTDTSQSFILEILTKVKEQGYQLDLNTAGFFKKYCLEPYPPLWLIKKAIALGIPLIYGSDSHSLEDIGRGYEKITDWFPLQ